MISLSNIYRQCKNISKAFTNFKIKHIPRVENVQADLLSKLASTKRSGNNRMVNQEILKEPGIQKEEVMQIEEDLASWQALITKDLQESSFPETPKDTLKIKKLAVFYTIIDNQLFKRGYLIPLLKYISKDQS